MVSGVSHGTGQLILFFRREDLIVKRFVATVVFFVSLIALSSSQLQAGILDDLIAAPVRIVDDAVPTLDLSTAIPTTNEISQVPAPQPANLLNYPVQVFHYGWSLHPTSRVSRHNGLLFFDF